MSKLSLEQRERSDRVTGAATIVDLRLSNIKADLKIPSPRLPLTFEHEVIPSMVTLSETLVVYHATYQIKATSASKTRVLDAEVTMSVIIELSDEGFTNDDLQAFGSIGVLDIVHPYVREVVHNLSARMGLPPLVLQVKVPPIMLDLEKADQA